MYFYVISVFTAMSQLLNSILGGYPDETFCSRAWRGKAEGNSKWGLAVSVLNSIFFWHENHCRGAYLEEISLYQTDPSIKEETIKYFSDKRL